MHTDRTVVVEMWSDAASAQAWSRRRRGDSDSEGDNERSFLEQHTAPRLEARAHVSGRKSQSEPGNNAGVLCVRRISGASRVFANKRDGRGHVASAGVPIVHACGCRCVLMWAPRRRGVVTPELAQQAGVLPNGQRQHDRKHS